MRRKGQPQQATAAAPQQCSASDRSSRGQRDVRAAALHTRIFELQSGQRTRAADSLLLEAPAPLTGQLARRDRMAPALGELPKEDASSRRPGSVIQRIASSLPSWLISAGFHTVLLIILVILTQGVSSPPPVMILSEVAARADVPQPLVPLFIQTPDTQPDDLALTNDLDPSPVEFGAPLVIQPPEIPVGMAVANVLMDHSGAMLAVGGKGNKEPERGKPGAQFFGVQAAGHDFVFIVDSSMSMTQKFADAKRELEYAIRKLSPDQRFYVLFFDRNTERMTFGSWDRKHGQYVFNAEPEPDLVPATTPNVDAFVQWMNTVQLELATNPYEATAFAINVLQPDAIFLLSDGEFTDRGATEWFLLGNNMKVTADATRHLRTIVHCIGFYSREGEVALKRIAEANGGAYRFVEPPPGYIPRFRTPRGGRRWGPR